MRMFTERVDTTLAKAILPIGDSSYREGPLKSKQFSRLHYKKEDRRWSSAVRHAVLQPVLFSTFLPLVRLAKRTDIKGGLTETEFADRSAILRLSPVNSPTLHGLRSWYNRLVARGDCAIKGRSASLYALRRKTPPLWPLRIAFTRQARIG